MNPEPAEVSRSAPLENSSLKTVIRYMKRNLLLKFEVELPSLFVLGVCFDVHNMIELLAALLEDLFHVRGRPDLFFVLLFLVKRLLFKKIYMYILRENLVSLKNFCIN